MGSSRSCSRCHWGCASYSAAQRYARKLTLGRAGALIGCGVLLFFTHLVFFALAGLAAAAALLFPLRPWRGLALRNLPLIICAAAAVGVLLLNSQNVLILESREVSWGISSDRVRYGAAQIISMGDPLCGYIVLGFLALWLITVRPPLNRTTHALGPALVMVLLFACGPQYVGQISFFERIPQLLLPLLLAAFAIPASPIRTVLGRALCAAAAIICLGVLHVRFFYFNREVGPFSEILAQVPPNRSLCAVAYAIESQYAPSAQYMHFAGWYPVVRGPAGLTQLSWSRDNAHMPVRMRNSAFLSLYGSNYRWDSWSPWEVDWQSQGRFEYFLLRIRGEEDLCDFKRKAEAPLVEVSRMDPWVLLRGRSPEHLPKTSLTGCADCL